MESQEQDGYVNCPSAHDGGVLIRGKAKAKAPNLARCHVVPPRLVSIVVIQHREHRLASLPTAQREEEVGTLADLTLDANGAAMRFDQPTRDG